MNDGSQGTVVGLMIGCPQLTGGVLDAYFFLFILCVPWYELFRINRRIGAPHDTDENPKKN